MVLADGVGTALGVHVAPATPAEVKLLEPTLNNGGIGRRRATRRRPKRLIADRGYDSNKVRALLAKQDIEPIIPSCSNNQVATHQDGRQLQRYRHRWIVARTNAWLQNFRRLTVRYERSAMNFTALIHLACALITALLHKSRVRQTFPESGACFTWNNCKACLSGSCGSTQHNG
jgi:transposase